MEEAGGDGSEAAAEIRDFLELHLVTMDAFLLKYRDGGSSCVLCFIVPFYVGSFRAPKRISLQFYISFVSRRHEDNSISWDTDI